MVGGSRGSRLAREAGSAPRGKQRRVSAGGSLYLQLSQVCPFICSS